MNFVFENKSTFENFLSCPDINASGIKRFTPSPVLSAMLILAGATRDFTSIALSEDPTNFDSYIIPTGVTHSPEDWLHHTKSNLFSFLNSVYLKDLQSGKAFLMLDQSHEGYHADWIFDELHLSCLEYKISPSQIIYVTGNLEVRRQYNKWLINKFVNGRLFVVGMAHFESLVYDASLSITVPTVQDHIDYKISNLDKIKTYNCLQKRPRAHRAWMFKSLFDSDLLSAGHNSMNFIEYRDTFYEGKFIKKETYDSFSKLLPMLPVTTEVNQPEIDIFADHNSGKYQLKFNEDIMLDSWVSVISEALFAEPTCFISEKSFKPIVCNHPFIIVGNKNSLKYLKEMGYKTFHPYIDETYDSLDTWERFAAITKAIKQIDLMSPEQKLKWYSEISNILEHNSNLIKQRILDEVPKPFLKIRDYVKG